MLPEPPFITESALLDLLREQGSPFGPGVFLRKRSFASVGEVLEEVERAGGSVALSTVSKALARMTDDVVIDRSDGGIRLLQPDKLLDLLAESFTPLRSLRVANAKLRV